MKNTLKIILYLFILLHLFVNCRDKYYLDEKYAGSYNLYGEDLMNLIREYYRWSLKYPKTMDNVIKFKHHKDMLVSDAFCEHIYGLFLMESAKNNKYTQEEREKFTFGFASFNFACMYKDHISINIYNDSIVVNCVVDGKDIFNMRDFMLNDCDIRYDLFSHGALYYRYVFFDSVDYPILNQNLYNAMDNGLRYIARNFQKSAIVYKEGHSYWKILLVSYHKQNGLTLLCPDDSIDLDSDIYMVDVKSFLSDFFNENPDISEIIVSLFYYENKKP